MNDLKNNLLILKINYLIITSYLIITLKLELLIKVTNVSIIERLRMVIRKETRTIFYLSEM